MWIEFAKQESLSSDQVALFKQYLALLVSWNKKFNLTTITDSKKIIQYHFRDSLALARVVDLKTISWLADVGSGGGFPGIPLAITNPDLDVTLIEVNQKKISFLIHVVKTLQLNNVAISEYDWRTFLRKPKYDIQLFCARASLQPKELIRIFQPSCAYNDASLIYWASAGWEPEKAVKPFIVRDVAYKIGTRRRRLILLQRSSS